MTAAIDPKVAALEATVANQAQQIEAMQMELDETNRGVVALYAELDTQAQQLQRATELKSRFLAYMSHEFRTPISALRSLSRLLLDRVDGPLTQEQEKQVSFIESTAEEFADMVDDLLDLAKVEAGRVDISPAWFEMVDLFSALRGMFRPVLTNPDVTLVFEEPQQASRLYTDNKMLSQILRNFISNALKFTLKRRGARVGAATRRRDHHIRRDGQRHRHRPEVPLGDLPGFHTGRFADPEAAARHRPRLVAQQATGRTAGWHGRPAERARRGVQVLRHDPAAPGCRRNARRRSSRVA